MNMYFFKDRFKNINNADATIGLDIGSSMIKWVNLGDDYKLKRYAIQSIPMSTGTTYNKNVAQIANRLKKTLLEQDTIKNCIVNIPDVLVCSKWTQVDVADKDTILEAIELLVEQSIPYPLNKLYYDYQIFDPSPESQKFKILIVACRKEHLDFRLDIIHQANLIPIVVEVSSYALERAYSFFYPDSLNEKSILLEIGISQLALLFLNSPQPIVYCENLVIKHDQDSILLQIKRCIKRYFLAYPCLFLKQLFIIGSNNSLLIFLLQELDGFLGLKIQIFKNKNQIKYNPELNSNEINQKFLDLFLSFGLALRINLARQRKKLNSKIK